jgi:hypothetical protein
MHRHVSFSEAKVIVATLGIRSKQEYVQNRGKRKEHHLPSQPSKTYAGDWQGWPNFLGKTYYQDKRWTPYDKAIATLREKGITSAAQFIDRRQELRDAGFPSDMRYYREWLGWFQESSVVSQPAVRADVPASQPVTESMVNVAVATQIADPVIDLQVARLKALAEKVAEPEIEDQSNDESEEGPKPTRQTKPAVASEFGFVPRGPGKRLTEARKLADCGAMTDLQQEFLLAVSDYKQVRRISFPTLSEIHEILLYLGYRRVADRGEYRLELSRELNIARGSKRCNRCEKYKSIDEFSANPRSADGHEASCQSCRSIDAAKKRADPAPEASVMYA